MNCKKCNRKYHWCSSCCTGGDEFYLSEGYCSEECYESSDEYENKITILNDFIFLLSDKQKKVYEFINEEYCDEDYELIKKLIKQNTK